MNGFGYLFITHRKYADTEHSLQTAELQCVVSPVIATRCK